MLIWHFYRNIQVQWQWLLVFSLFDFCSLRIGGGAVVGQTRPKVTCTTVGVRSSSASKKMSRAIGSLSKPLWQWQREPQQTNGLGLVHTSDGSDGSGVGVRRSSDLVWIGMSEATEAEAESEEKEYLLIPLTPIPSNFRLRLRFHFLIYTFWSDAPCASDSDSASDSVASVTSPKSSYISLPSSENQEREMTRFFVIWRTWTTKDKF